MPSKPADLKSLRSDREYARRHGDRGDGPIDRTGHAGGTGGHRPLSSPCPLRVPDGDPGRTAASSCSIPPPRRPSFDALPSPLDRGGEVGRPPRGDRLAPEGPVRHPADLPTPRLGRAVDACMRRSCARLHPCGWLDQPVSPDLAVFRQLQERYPGIEVVDRRTSSRRCGRSRTIRTADDAGGGRDLPHAYDRMRTVRPGMSEWT